MKLKTMAGTLTIIIMLSTPTLAQATIALNKSPSQSEIVELRTEALGLDIEGSSNEIKAQLKKANLSKQQFNLQAKAKALNIDISGLSNDQARIKIKAAERITTLSDLLSQAKTLGIGIEIGTAKELT